MYFHTNRVWILPPDPHCSRRISTGGELVKAPRSSALIPLESASASPRIETTPTKSAPNRGRAGENPPQIEAGPATTDPHLHIAEASAATSRGESRSMEQRRGAMERRRRFYLRLEEERNALNRTGDKNMTGTEREWTQGKVPTYQKGEPCVARSCNARAPNNVWDDSSTFIKFAAQKLEILPLERWLYFRFIFISFSNAISSVWTRVEVTSCIYSKWNVFSAFMLGTNHQ